MLTHSQKQTAQAIVNVFETGKALGDYGQVTYVENDLGQLSYGRSQVTLASGNLYLLIKAYCDIAGAAQAGTLRPYLPALYKRDPACNTDMTLRGLLRAAGDDPAMRTCQDDFFDQGYWNPALKAASGLSLTPALSVAIVYDSFIQGSWGTIRDRTLTKNPDAAADPKAWSTAYVATRRDWLANSSNAMLRKTVYRMDTFQDLINRDAWDLPLPLTVRGLVLTQALLEGTGGGGRALRLSTPPMRGDDVKALQNALGLTEDGVFGPVAVEAVKAFQQRNGLTADGIAGPSTLAALGL
jgi:chitosanase